MKKTTLITLLLLLLFVQSKAQTVTGRIVDSEKQAVVMATIALQTLDSINICATTADADGRFVLTADSIPLPFRLIVSSIGYETVMPECASYAVGDVVLATKTNVLGDVVVKSKRPIKCAGRQNSGGRIVHCKGPHCDMCLRRGEVCTRHSVQERQ